MNKDIIFILILLGFYSFNSQAAFTNYNSILIGDRAAGMGGAHSALTGDPAASSYYNPATLSRIDGSSLSTSVSVYNKYDTIFGANADLQDAALRANQGAFVPVPTSSGSVYSFRNLAFALSIVIPDSETYEGEVRSEDDGITLLNFSDQSLWVGGTLGLNINEKESIGLSMYYTSRNFTSSLTDRVEDGSVTTLTNEEKTLTNNSIVYILGFYHKFNKNWSLGLSHRFGSIEVAGRGTLFVSEVSTDGTDEEFNEIGILSDTRIPQKTTLGIAFEQKGKLALSADITYHDSERYRDLDHTRGDTIIHDPTWNIHLGGEYFYYKWLGIRAGIYTNLASTPEIPENPTERFPDHVDMWGFSANAAIYTSKQSSVTLGGYYTGGKGQSVQFFNGQETRLPKAQQIFTFLVGTTFRL